MAHFSTIRNKAELRQGTLAASVMQCVMYALS
jgi:hypothetical protein